MTRTLFLKLVLAVSLAVFGIGYAQPAEAYLHPCSWEYCEENPNCSCKCWEVDERTYKCSQAPLLCFA